MKVRDGHIPADLELEDLDEEDARGGEEHDERLVARTGRDVEVRDVRVRKVLAVLDVLEPLLAECFPLLVRLAKGALVRDSREGWGKTHAEDAVGSGKPGEADAVERGLVKDGGRVPDPFGDVVGEVEKPDGGLRDHAGEHFGSAEYYEARKYCSPDEALSDALEEPNGASSLGSLERLGLREAFESASGNSSGWQTGRTARPSNPLATLVTNDVAPAVTP